LHVRRSTRLQEGTERRDPRAAGPSFLRAGSGGVLPNADQLLAVTQSVELNELRAALPASCRTRSPWPSASVGGTVLRHAKEAFADLVGGGKATPRGAPRNPLQLRATFWHFRHESRVASPPHLAHLGAEPHAPALVGACQGVRRSVPTTSAGTARSNRQRCRRRRRASRMVIAEAMSGTPSRSLALPCRHEHRAAVLPASDNRAPCLPGRSGVASKSGNRTHPSSRGRTRYPFSAALDLGGALRTAKAEVSMPASALCGSAPSCQRGTHRRTT
jgi:hypothetical protein